MLADAHLEPRPVYISSVGWLPVLRLSAFFPRHPTPDPRDAIRGQSVFLPASFWRHLCLHLFMNSVLLFIDLLSLPFMIASFLLRHTSHLSLPTRYGWHFLTILYLTSWIPIALSFLFQICVDIFFLDLLSLLFASVLCSYSPLWMFYLCILYMSACHHHLF